MESGEVFSHIWHSFDTGRVVPICAWCGRVRIDDTWLVPPPAVLTAIDERHALSHTICERCVDALPVSERRAAPSDFL